MARGNRKQEIKKWCLLEDGSIEPCYYADGSMRSIYKEGWNYYLDHDVYAHQMIIFMHHRIVKFADTAEELINGKR